MKVMDSSAVSNVAFYLGALANDERLQECFLHGLLHEIIQVREQKLPKKEECKRNSRNVKTYLLV